MTSNQHEVGVLFRRIFHKPTARYMRHLTIAGCGLIFACADPDPVQDTPDMNRPDLVEDMADLPTSEMSTFKIVGDPCDGPLSCGQNMACVNRPGGFVCMDKCDTAYRICPQGEVCTAVSGGTVNVCYLGGAIEQGQSCTSNIECQKGLLCIGTSEERYCMQACHRDDASCPQGQACLFTQSDRGFCHATVGTPCDENTPCAQGLTCSNTLDAPYPTRAPVPICTKTQCNDDCPTGSRCIQVDAQGNTMCINACQTDADCIFGQDFRCKGDAICSQSADPTACLQWIGQNKLCIHKDAIF